MQTVVEWALPLQLWGGTFYLLHKICCSRYERTKKYDPAAAQAWRVRSWAVYLTGLPAVVLMLLLKANWIFAALEASALPVMLLGLVLAAQGRSKRQIDQLLGRLDSIVYALIGFGLGYSCCYFGGFVTFNQWLEISASGGFLIGTYLQTKDDERQYLAYMVMNVSTGLLFWRENYIWFMLQQVASIAFVIDAWRVRTT
jgi:hypothetical protein